MESKFNIFDNFKNNKILIVGDIMLDTYLIGKVERISPEAPVPVVDIEEKTNKLGGAANVALNIKELGASPILCSVIGDDQRGLELIDLLKKNGLQTKFIFKSDKRKTTNKIRIIGNNVQILRIDEETKTEVNGDIFTKLKQNIAYTIAENKIDGIIFQDYDKGVITQQLIEYISILSIKRNIPVFVDPKLKNFNYYKNIKIFKPNFNELKRGLNLQITDKKELLETGAKILHERGIEIVFVTLSEDGIFISYNKDKKIINKIVPAIPINVVDVSGAGDSIISLLSLLIDKIDIEKIAEISNIAGGIVCGEVGVVPINKDMLLNKIQKVENNSFIMKNDLFKT